MLSALVGLGSVGLLRQVWTSFRRSLLPVVVVVARRNVCSLYHACVPVRNVCARSVLLHSRETLLFARRLSHRVLDRQVRSDGPIRLIVCPLEFGSSR
jgi:hypothetical protein